MFVAIPALMSFPGSAVAQPGCAASGALGLATVTISSPSSGTVPAQFKVRGQASASLPLVRAELFVADSAGERLVASRSFPGATTVSFEFDVGPETVGAGARSLRVVACGDGAIAGTSLVRGESSAVAVQVQPSPTTTSSTTRPVAPASSTTVAPTTSTTKAKLSVAAGPVPGEPTRRLDAGEGSGLVGGGANGRAVLSPPSGAEEPSPLALSGERDPSDLPPQRRWVGLVVIGSGAVALALSTAASRVKALTH